MAGELEEIRDMVQDLRERCNVILIVIETALGLGDAEFPAPGGTFEAPEPEEGVDPVNARDLPVAYCPLTEQHDPHEWAYVSELGKGDAKFCPGIPF